MVSITKKTAYFLVISYTITLVAFITIIFYFEVPTKLLSKLGISASLNYKYTDNPAYDVRRSLFSVYKPKEVKVVMLGDSITYEADWNELLSRVDVVNRGIGLDTTEGLINRLSDIYILTPEICFMMGGINDIVKGIPVSGIFSNIRKISEELQSHNITPVIQSILFVSITWDDWREMNKKVNDLNRMLRKYSKEKGIIFVDVNQSLSKDGALDVKYTYDGVHLLGNGFEKWRDLILMELK